MEPGPGHSHPSHPSLIGSHLPRQEAISTGYVESDSRDDGGSERAWSRLAAGAAHARAGTRLPRVPCELPACLYTCFTVRPQWQACVHRPDKSSNDMPRYHTREARRSRRIEFRHCLHTTPETLFHAPLPCCYNYERRKQSTSALHRPNL